MDMGEGVSRVAVSLPARRDAPMNRPAARRGRPHRAAGTRLALPDIGWQL